MLISYTTRRRLLAAQLVIAPLGVGVLFYLLVEALPFVQLQDVADVLAGSFVLALAGFALFGVRLRYVLDAFALPVPTPAVWRIHLTSLFYYFFLPAGVGYDLSKGAKLALQVAGSSKRRIAAAVLSERLIGGVGVYLLLLGALPFIELADGSHLQRFIPAAWAWPLLVAVTVVSALSLLRWVRRRRAQEVGLLFPAIAASAAGHLLVAVAIWSVAQSLALPVNLAEVVGALAGTLLFQLIPVNLVGVSLGEVAAVAVYLALGLSQPEALLLATIGYSHRLVAAVVGGALEGVSAVRMLQR